MYDPKSRVPLPMAVGAVSLATVWCFGSLKVIRQFKHRTEKQLYTRKMKQEIELDYSS